MKVCFGIVKLKIKRVETLAASGKAESCPAAFYGISPLGKFPRGMRRALLLHL